MAATFSFHFSDDGGATFRQAASGQTAADVSAHRARIRTAHSPLLVITADVAGAETAWRKSSGGLAWMWRAER